MVKRRRTKSPSSDALTKRINVLLIAAKQGEADITPDTLRPIVEDAVAEALASTVSPAEATTEDVLQQQQPAGLPEAASRTRPPLAGAKQAENGAWYVRDLQNAKGYRPVT